jgi:membrane protease YdiL (CAAX protease family)
MLFDIRYETFSGVLFGALTFLLGIPFDALILLLRKKFSLSNTEREEKLAKLVSFSSSRSRTQMIFKVLILTFSIGLLEEIIFRGYLLYHLTKLFPSLIIVTLTMQAFVYFTAHLYQGIFKSLQTFLGGFMFGVAFFFSGSLLTVITARLTRDITALTIQFTPRRKRC